MNRLKNLDSCIQILKGMRGDQSNELGSEQQRALAEGIRKLKKLRKQPKLNQDELYLVVSDIAESISKIL
jgi:hypothetical protein